MGLLYFVCWHSAEMIPLYHAKIPVMQKTLLSKVTTHRSGFGVGTILHVGTCVFFGGDLNLRT